MGAIEKGCSNDESGTKSQRVLHVKWLILLGDGWNNEILKEKNNHLCLMHDSVLSFNDPTLQNKDSTVEKRVVSQCCYAYNFCDHTDFLDVVNKI